MKKVILFVVVSQISLLLHGQIIADHAIVDDYDKIPQYYIDKVKKMRGSIAGLSHASGYLYGLRQLEALDSRFQVLTQNSDVPPSASTSSYLRFGKNVWDKDVPGWVIGYGEEDWFLNEAAINKTKAGIKYCHDNKYDLDAQGFGWCHDYGISFPDYINATQQYVDYCKSQGYNTKIYFTTGTVNNEDDEIYSSGNLEDYTKFIGYETIRDHVKAKEDLILFDYADILCWNDEEQQYTLTYNGNVYPWIHPDNMGGEYYAHIGTVGTLRLAKAMWWMLARIAGWDGVTSTTVPVASITITTAGGITTIAKDNGTLQLIATVLPANASNKNVTWSISNGTGQASISQSGLLTSVSNGTVTAKATAKDGSGSFGTILITITNQLIRVTGVKVTGEDGVTSITKDDGTLQLNVSVTPSNASNKSVTWSISNGTGQALITQSGLVTAVSNGTVTAKATAKDGSGVYGTMNISISNQDVPVESITITSDNGGYVIPPGQVTLQLYVNVKPSKASEKTVIWTIENLTGEAKISSTGLVTALKNGTVRVTAIATDGSDALGTIEILIKSIVYEPILPIVSKTEIKIPIEENYIDCNLSLYNLQGYMIKNMLIESNLCTFSISDLPAGIYILVVSGKMILKVGKVLIPG